MASVGYVLLRVSDMGRARAFYTGVLGWTLVPWGRGQFCTVSIPSEREAQLEIAFGSLHDWSPPELSGIVVLVTNLAALGSALLASGGSIRNRVVHPDLGEVAVQFEDTEGNRIWAITAASVAT